MSVNSFMAMNHSVQIEDVSGVARLVDRSDGTWRPLSSTMVELISQHDSVENFITHHCAIYWIARELEALGIDPLFAQKLPLTFSDAIIGGLLVVHGEITVASDLQIKIMMHILSTSDAKISFDKIYESLELRVL